MKSHGARTIRPAVPKALTRRGIATLLAMIFVVVAFVLSLGFLAAQGTSEQVARNLSNKVKARMVAESGLEITLGYLNNDPNWRTTKTPGAWVQNASFNGGTFTVTVVDGQDTNGDGIVEGDGSLADDPYDPATVTVVGDYNGASFTVQGVAQLTDATATVLMVVPNKDMPSAAEANRKLLIESWGMGVMLISQTASQAEFNTALDSVEVVYVVGTCSENALGTKLTTSSVSVVVEENVARKLLEKFQTCKSTVAFSSTGIKITNNTHYITSPFGVGNLTLASGSQQLIKTSSANVGVGCTALAETQSDTNLALVAFESGSELLDGSPAVSRRVVLPWRGDTDTNNLNDNGKTILQRSLQWGIDGGPIIAFGNTATPGFGYIDAKNANGRQMGYQLTVPESGTLVGVSVYINGVPPKLVRFAWYSDRNGEPDQLLAETPGYATREMKYLWITTSTPAASIGPGPVWIAFALDHTNMHIMVKPTGGQFRIKNYDPIPGGYIQPWGVSNGSTTWEVGAYGWLVPDSKKGPARLKQKATYTARW